jgi:SAM-dependent methyltransferase
MNASDSSATSDAEAPSSARIYDYALGGKDNYEVDRRALEKVMEGFPTVRIAARHNRQFMHRAVDALADAGVKQFLDIGTGIPTEPNLHQVAQERAPEARVVYVDNDPVAVAHSKAVLADNPDATIAAADLRDPVSILEHPETRRLLDFGRPVALMLVAVVHFLPDADDPAGIIATLRDALAPGSVMVITHATLGGPAPEGQRAAQEVYRRTATPLLMRSKQELEPFFAGFELVEPGIVPLAYWRPDGPLTEDDEAVALHGLAGVGLKA